MKSRSIRSILVPIDFSKVSIQPIETAKILAKRFGATVHLVHIYEYYYPVGLMEPGAPAPTSIITFREETARRLASLRTLASKHGLSSGACHLLEGTSTFNEICKLAREIRADLIVTSTHGYTGLKHVLLGSTAERIVQHSPCPVFVSRPRRRGAATPSMFNKILVPVDFSACSMDGTNYAIQFAARFAAKLILVHASPIGVAYTGDGYAMYDLTAVTNAVKKNAESQMRDFVRNAKFGGVKFETVVMLGSRAPEICAIAEDQNADLIITSTHGRSGLGHVLIGSVAEHVVRYATCPVLVVPSHPEMRVANLPGRPESRPKAKSRVGRSQRQKQKAIESEQLIKTHRKVTAHPFPERRKTNKFRESHSGK